VAVAVGSGGMIQKLSMEKATCHAWIWGWIDIGRVVLIGGLGNAYGRTLSSELKIVKVKKRGVGVVGGGYSATNILTPIPDPALILIVEILRVRSSLVSQNVMFLVNEGHGLHLVVEPFVGRLEYLWVIVPQGCGWQNLSLRWGIIEIFTPTSVLKLDI